MRANAVKLRKQKAVNIWTEALVRTAETIGRQLWKPALDPTAVHANALAETCSLFVHHHQKPDQPSSQSAWRFKEAALRAPLTPDVVVASYERVLNFVPTITQGRYALAKQFGARKATGSYFTPDWLVELLVEHALIPVLDRQIAAATGVDTCFEKANAPGFDLTEFLQRWSKRQREQAQEALLSLTVCDPACGPGAFLLSAAETLARHLALLRRPRPTVSPQSLRQARTDVARHCMYGVDRDPQAVRLAQFALQLVARGQENETGDKDSDSLDKHLRNADSLGIENPFDWPTVFGEVFGGKGGFDAVLSNPPYANAIEGVVDQEFKTKLTKAFPDLRGTADLAYYFLALAHRLTAPDGAIGLVLPRGVLTAPAVRRLRQQLLEERPPSLIYTPQDQFLFDGANIFVALVVLQKDRQCLGSRDGKAPRFFPIDIEDENWWAPLLRKRQAESANASPLGDQFEVFASMTTGMAYDVLSFVQEDETRQRGPRLVTTGLIDPGVCHWGYRPCRYLSRRFERPVIARSRKLPKSVAGRLERVRRPKVLVAGLSNRVEAFLDHEARFCGAVSTFTILHPRDDIRELAKVCDYLNSEPATGHLVLELGAHAMGGGRITLNKNFLRRLPYNS